MLDSNVRLGFFYDFFFFFCCCFGVYEDFFFQKLGGVFEKKLW